MIQEWRGLCGRTWKGVETTFTWFQGVLRINPKAQKRCKLWETNEPLQSFRARLNHGEKVFTDTSSLSCLGANWAFLFTEEQRQGSNIPDKRFEVILSTLTERAALPTTLYKRKGDSDKAQRDLLFIWYTHQGIEGHPYLGHPAQIGRELQGGNVASFISNYDNRVDRVKLNMGYFILLLGHHWLGAESFILINAEIKHMGLRKKKAKNKD